MNTKGVEDGMRECVICGFKWFPRKNEEPCPCSEIHAIRSATPASLTAQAENRGKNYKPGPRQAVPFMPQPAVPEASTARSWGRIVVPGRGDIIGVRTLENGQREFLMHNEALCDTYYVALDGSKPTPIPEERTATLLDGYMKDPEFAAAFNEEKKLLDAEERDRLQEKNESLWQEMLSFQHNTATGEWIGSGWTPVQMARVIEESSGIREEITKLTAELARERELNQGLRQATLMEALKAVEKERLDTHDERLREAENFNLYRKETGEDAAYSLAIHHVESAIKKLIEPLLEDKSKPVVTNTEEESR